MIIVMMKRMRKIVKVHFTAAACDRKSYVASLLMLLECCFLLFRMNTLRFTFDAPKIARSTDPAVWIKTCTSSEMEFVQACGTSKPF